MAYTTVNKSADYFNTVTYTGNATDNRTVTGIGFQPDWLWIKNRADTEQHRLQDAVRGATKNIKSSGDGAEETTSNTVKSFDSDGFTLGVDNAINGNSDAMVSWNWKANGAGSANTDGSINSTVSVNTTAGFSIVKWTGNGTNDATIGHGLGVAPKMIIIKNTTDTVNWRVWHTSLSANHVLFLNNNQSEKDPSQQGNGYIKTVGTSTFSTYAGNTNDEGVNGNGDAMIAYCFAEKTGYSKFGSYVGNGNADGTFAYLGFKPHFFLIKRVDSDEDWIMTDSKRGFPQSWNYVLASTSAAEASGLPYDFLSNGVKFRGATQNVNGATFLYMAFGQSIVGSNNIPATAR